MNPLNSKLIIGGAQFGSSYGIANKVGHVKKQEVKSILDFAFKNGISFIDTAKSYGNSENIIGSAIIGNEKNWNIITKYKSHHENIELEFEKSLINFNCPPKIILSHSYEHYMKSGTFEIFDKLKKENKVKKIGVSVYTAEEIESVLKINRPDVIQLPMSILDSRLYKNGALDKIKEKGIEIHIRSVFLQGLFFLSKKQIENKFPDAVNAIDKLNFISKENNLSLAELSLLWTCSIENVDKVIIGVDSVLQLKQHLSTLTKKVNKLSFYNALKVNYDNEKVLNPSNWN